MKIAILGGGSVAQTFGSRLIALGHQVQLGIRNPDRAELAKPRANAVPLAEWVAATGGTVATYAGAAAFGEITINAASGVGSLEALAMAGAASLEGKLLIDLANALDFSHGMPPSVSAAYGGASSLGEQIQAAYPGAKVVKAFNTIAAAVGANPALVPGAHELLIAGNDPAAKAAVTALARELGWTAFIDLGGITGARGMEQFLPLAMLLFGALGTGTLGLKVMR